jgi:hypothetical protein
VGEEYFRKTVKAQSWPIAENYGWSDVTEWREQKEMRLKDKGPDPRAQARLEVCK